MSDDILSKTEETMARSIATIGSKLDQINADIKKLMENRYQTMRVLAAMEAAVDVLESGPTQDTRDRRRGRLTA